MSTRPSSDELEGCIIALDEHSNLSTQKAQVTATMMQALLQCVRQRLPVEQQVMARERNEMLPRCANFRSTWTGPRARWRRGSILGCTPAGSYPDAAPIPAFDDNVAIYREAQRGARRHRVDDLDEPPMRAMRSPARHWRGCANTWRAERRPTSRCSWSAPAMARE
ncbi:MAG: hypothetical protein U5Q44_04220 [Dehalococcoidia bacterium]|nr:hypothetical protein [Dehalococcoidia bacterium]